MPRMQPSTFCRDTEASLATFAYVRGSSTLSPGKPHKRDGGTHPVALPQVIPKGCMLQSPPRKAPFLDLLRRGGSLLLEKGGDTPASP